MTETNDKSASMTIKAWICSAMQVDDEPQEGRIVISVGSLRFPVPYEVLALETDRMIMVQEGGDNAKYTSPKTIMGMSAQALKDASGPEFRRRIFIDKPKK